MARVYLFYSKKAIIAGFLALFLAVPTTAHAKVPTDPDYWQQRSVWEQIGAPTAWDHTTGSADVVVAVIDTGVDTWHSDLVENIWTNPDEIPDNGRDDDANGFIDDLHGWNFIDNNNDPRTSVFNTDDDKDAVAHGTVGAGLIGASGNNNEFGVGLNWRVSVMPVRAVNSSGNGSFGGIIDAVKYALDNGADVINMSFSGDSDHPALRRLLRYGYDQGTVTVVAAGNHNGLNGNLDFIKGYPACFDAERGENWLLTVGSVNENDRMSTFSNFGNCVDIYAPGENIFSTERYAPAYGYDEAFGGEWQGTSFSAPLVSGTAALLKALHPEWSAETVVQQILDTADVVRTPIASSSPRFASIRRLNTGRAVALAVTAPTEVTGELVAVGYAGRAITKMTIENGIITETVVAETPTAAIRSVAFSSREGVVAALIEEQGVYRVRTWTLAGEEQNSFSVPTREGRARITPKSLDVTSTGTVVVEEYFPATRRTRFTEFTSEGERLERFTVPSAVTRWSTGKTLRRLFIVTGAARSPRLSVYELDDPATVASVALPAGARVEAIGSAPYWPELGEQAVVIFKAGSDVNQLVVDVESDTTYVSSFVPENPSSVWNLVPATRAGGTGALVRLAPGENTATLLHLPELVEEPLASPPPSLRYR